MSLWVTTAATRWLSRHRFLSVGVEFKIDPVKAPQGRSADWMGQRLGGIGPLFEMIETLSDDDRVFDTRDHFDAATTLVAGLDINLEYPFQALGLRLMAACRWAGVLHSLTARPRRAGVTFWRRALLHPKGIKGRTRRGSE